MSPHVDLVLADFAAAVTETELHLDSSRTYTEREVNQVLVEYHDDVAALRRGLVSHKLMERAQGVYRRIVRSPET